jgi:NAD(P)-dependent dehydrogenase (short-subunit alcohol dehydrogenase family)
MVTGAGSGIGRAAALRFAAEGATVVCADLDETAVAATAQAAGEPAVARAVDVADEASTLALAGRHPAVDVLVHCAGVLGDGDALATSPASWGRVLAVNLTGTWLMARAVLPGMLERGRGAIVNLASVAGLAGIPANAAYAAAKGGVVALTRQMAVDFAAGGVRVNAICPGTLPTPLVRARFPDAAAAEAGLARAASRYPARRLGTAEEVAGLALYLASDEAAWVNGAAIPVDGGLLAAAWLPGA